MPSVFWKKTNYKTVTGKNIYKTLKGNYVTASGTPVIKRGMKWVSENNRFKMSNYLRSVHGRSVAGLNLFKLANNYNNLYGFSERYY
jgi:hypothetical protein